MEVICRLCLKDAINEYGEIDQAMEQMFDILSLKLDLKICKDPIICQDCLGVATKCLSFKSSCIDTEEIILSYFTDVEHVKHNIKTIYRQWKRVETVVDDDLSICRFCMAQLEKDNFVSLDDFMNENMFEMLSEYIPEMDLNIIEDPIICVTCRENLQAYLKFTLNCLDIEEKIKAYCREEGTDRMGQVKLDNLLNFLCKYPAECTQKCAFKKELTTFEDTENAYLEAYTGFIKEELDIKEEINLEGDCFESRSEMKLDKYDDRIHPKGYGTETKSNKISLKTKEHSNKECTYQKKIQANIEEDCSFHEDILGVKRNSSNQQPTHKDPLKIKMYKCSRCTYKVKQKRRLKRHMSVHMHLEIKMYKCSFCGYEVKRKAYLEQHMLDHKDPSEIKIYKCSFCAYEIRQKSSFKAHMTKVHRDSVVKMTGHLFFRQ